MAKPLFAEIGSRRLLPPGLSAVPGDYQQVRTDNRIVLSLVTGGGASIAANVRASVAGSMAVAALSSQEWGEAGSESVVKTFGEDYADLNPPFGFTMLRIGLEGEVLVEEYRHPEFLRLGAQTQPRTGSPGLSRSEFTARLGERIVVFNRGVVDSGKGTHRLPGGWTRQGVEDFCKEQLATDADLSAAELSRRVIAQAELNDMFTPKAYMECVTVYFRRPRRILVVTGPPYKQTKDPVLADLVDRYEGTKLICGGTTATILAREMHRKITVDLSRDPAGLPPVSTMEGVDLITEGVLTLSKVLNLLENHSGGEVIRKGTDGRVAKMLLEHDIVDFVVGTRVNPLHQDPNLPVELEMRRNLIKNLAAILKEKYLKEVKIQFI